MITMKTTLGFCLLLALVSLNDCDPIKSEICKNDTKADVVILLDSSNSITVKGYGKATNFISEFAKKIPIGKDRVQLALAQFSSTYKHDGYFIDYPTADVFTKAVLNLTQIHTNTATDKALRHVCNGSYFHDPKNGARKGVPKLLIIITDGNSNTPSKTIEEARKCRNQSIQIIAVAVGVFNPHELEEVAGSPNNVYKVKSFSAITTIKESLVKTVCEATPTVAPCIAGQIDLVWCQDSSGSIGKDNYEIAKDFMGDILTSFSINDGESGTHIGIIYFGSAAHEYLQLTGDEKSVVNAIHTLPYRGSLTNTSDCINKASVWLQNGRIKAAKILIVATDGRSQNGEATKEASNIAKKSGILSIAVGITSSISIDELNNIASGSENVFFSDSFEHLKYVVRDVAKGACKAANLN